MLLEERRGMKGCVLRRGREYDGKVLRRGSLNESGGAGGKNDEWLFDDPSWLEKSLY